MPSPDAPPASGPRPYGFLARVVDLIAAPARLFDRLRERPAWLVPWLLAIAAGVLWAFGLPGDVLEHVARETAPEGATNEAIVRAAGQLRVLQALFGALLYAVVPPLVAGVCWLLFRLILGGSAGYGRWLAASTHAFLLPALGGLGELGLVHVTGDIERRLSLDLLVPLSPDSWAGAFLGNITVFGLWAALLLGLAASRLDPERKTVTGTVLLVTLYLMVAASAATFATG